jgi:hypothetical protein
MNPIAQLAAQVQKIQTAESAGRSTSTLNRLWREYFRIEDLVKGQQKGGF